MLKLFQRSRNEQLPMRDPDSLNRKFFTIQIAELRALRPPLDQLMSSLPKGFDTLVSWVLFGPEGTYMWEYHEDPSVERHYERQHVESVSAHVSEYWDRQYFDASYGSFAGSVGGVPYDKIIEYFEFVIGYLISFVNAHLPHIIAGDFLRITGFTVRQAYVIVYYD